MGNKKIVNRLSQNTKFMKNKEFFTYSAGHPGGFLVAFINVYELIYKSYFKKKVKPNILINLKSNLNIINVLNKFHISSIKKAWQEIVL